MQRKEVFFLRNSEEVFVTKKVKEKVSGAADVEIIFVGEGSVGKTSLVMTYLNKEFPDEYIPTVFDKTIIETEYHGENITVGITDTATHLRYDNHKYYIPPHYMVDSDVVVMCFSCDDQTSLDEIQKRKLDLRNVNSNEMDGINEENENRKTQKDIKMITFEDGIRFAKEVLNAHLYFETSAKSDGKGVDELFQKLIILGKGDAKVSKKKEKSEKCITM